MVSFWRCAARKFLAYNGSYYSQREEQWSRQLSQRKIVLLCVILISSRSDSRVMVRTLGLLWRGHEFWFWQEMETGKFRPRTELKRVDYVCEMNLSTIFGANSSLLAAAHFTSLKPLSDVDSHRRLRSESTAEVLVPSTVHGAQPLATVLLPSPVHVLGTMLR